MIPFGMMPGSWGLKGKSYKMAKAEYELEGEELEYRLMEIQHDFDDVGEDEVPSIDYQKHKLALDLKYNHISQGEHDLDLASLEERPYVRVKDSGFDFKEGLGGFWMEMDWNSYFIDFLNQNGYTEHNDVETVELWITDIYKSQIMEQEIGPEPEDSTEFTNVVDLGNGKTSYE